MLIIFISIIIRHSIIIIIIISYLAYLVHWPVGFFPPHSLKCHNEGPRHLVVVKTYLFKRGIGTPGYTKPSWQQMSIICCCTSGWTCHIRSFATVARWRMLVTWSLPKGFGWGLLWINPLEKTMVLCEGRNTLKLTKSAASL